ncbi:MAG: TlpA family protein disulfide reductase [Cyclobacteriaceae bacterium]|nr:TlpA family protein disulfide reductase [Cyclobacteriaceae bacterium]
MKRSIPGLLFLLFVFGCASPSKESGMKLSRFDLVTLSGEAIDMSQYEGKTVFINVWATWCKPCVQEMPTIALAMEKLKDRQVVFLFASNEDVEDIAGFRDNRKFPFDYVRLKNLEALPIDALPATFIFDPQGKLIYGEEGFRDWSTAENLLLITPTAQP